MHLQVPISERSEKSQRMDATQCQNPKGSCCCTRKYNNYFCTSHIELELLSKPYDNSASPISIPNSLFRKIGENDPIANAENRPSSPRVRVPHFSQISML